MAIQWFTTQPNRYFMKQTARGGRNEILFAVLGCAFVDYLFFSPLRQGYWKRRVQPEWNRTVVNGSRLTLQK